MPICANKFNYNKCGHFSQFIIICVPYSGVLVILQVPRIISPFWEQLCNPNTTEGFHWRIRGYW